jgi:hypothetical protein
LAKAQSTGDGKHDSSTKYLHLLLAQMVLSDFATSEILACPQGAVINYVKLRLMVKEI